MIDIRDLATWIAAHARQLNRMRKQIATGSLFQKSYKDRSSQTRNSQTCFLKFYLSGAPVEDSTGPVIYRRERDCDREATTNKELTCCDAHSD
jgi:hypothetical protein